MKLLTTITALFLFFLTADAQTITGTITDQKTGEQLIGASISIKGTSNGTLADVEGLFKIVHQQSFPVTLICSYLGYVTKEIEIKNTDKIKISLQQQQTLVKEISITDTRLTVKQRESPLTIEAMDIIAIRESPAANFYEGLGQLKGVDVTSASLGFKVINTRGFNSTSPVRSLQIIDGVDNQSPGLNFSLGNFLGCSEQDVLKCDLIAGASSAYYGPNAFNGVISMTTRSPFVKPGFEITAKSGTRNLLETSMRYSFVIKNKMGADKFGVKLNAFFMKAKDWEASNLSPTPQSHSSQSNPGGYDAVNIYGDEYLSFADATSSLKTSPGLGIYYRKGYAEKDLVDYNTQNIKLNGSVHYLLNHKQEIIYSSNFGYGTTIYQGDNRYSLKDIKFYQNRIEYRKENKFFLRFYTTNEDAGKSYDAYFTALLLQKATKNDIDWSKEYRTYYDTAIVKLVQALPGYLFAYQGFGSAYLDSLRNFLGGYNDLLTAYHHQTSNFVNNNASYGHQAFFEPGSARFDSAFAAITSKESYSQGGSRFFDRSALYHGHGEYKYTIKFNASSYNELETEKWYLKPFVKGLNNLANLSTGFLNFFNNMEVTTGMSARLYKPNSHGTIFSDTSYYQYNITYNADHTVASRDSQLVYKKITNFEWGAYIGLEKKLAHNKIKLNATSRIDKNENFPYLWSPALSAVYSPNKNHTIRINFSSAIRNPTLADQYLFYPVGRALLVGNIKGYDSLVTVESFVNALNFDNVALLHYFNVKPVVPEKVKTAEIGYRTSLFNHLYIDFNAYYSEYNDFIGYKIGTKMDILTIYNGPFFPPSKKILFKNFYRVATNSEEIVTTSGASIGFTYFFRNFYEITGNYSFNQLNKKSDDPLIPAYNTPKNKFNIGFNGRDIVTSKIKNWGFSINYKWVQGFLFEGSPQFTGSINTYSLVDMQINKKFPETNTTIKLGIQNLMNNKHYEVYGGPLVGRMAYFQVSVSLD